MATPPGTALVCINLLWAMQLLMFFSIPRGLFDSLGRHLTLCCISDEYLDHACLNLFRRV